jgi:prepilin-type N-terminal cleavage/methylation domain-containing protein
MPFQRVAGIRAFTLTELLVTLGIIALLAAIGIPAWIGLARSHDSKASVAAVMGALAQARASALSSKSEVWILFGKNGMREGMVPVRRQGADYAPGTWVYLAPGSLFDKEDSSVLTQPVPEAVLQTVLKPGATVSGGILFQPNGRIPVPNGRGGQLTISLGSRPGQTRPATKILLSRATGRATCQ